MAVKIAMAKRPLFSLIAAVSIVLFSSSFSWADVIINVLAVNGKNQPMEKDVQFSLPGELKPDDIVDADGLKVDYNVNEAGYSLHGKVLLQAKETKTFRVRIKDLWRVSDQQISDIRASIEEGFKEMGAERSAENGQALRQKLLSQLDYIITEQAQASGNIDQRIDSYRNHLQTLSDIRNKASLIDYWRSDATDEESRKPINFIVSISNPSDKQRKVKQPQYLPSEVRPEYIINREGYEIRFDDKKGKPFLFKEEDLAPGEKKDVRIAIKDVWFVHQKDMLYIRERADGIFDTLKNSKYDKTAQALMGQITNGLDFIDMMQASQQEDIQQHIGVYRINAKRFQQARTDLDSLEKLLSRYRAELEKSRIKNVMQKVRAMKSLARVSEAIFDKKPTVNAAWKLIGFVMIFLAILTMVHFVVSLVRSGREKKQEEIKLPRAKEQEKA